MRELYTEGQLGGFVQRVTVTPVSDSQSPPAQEQVQEQAKPVEKIIVFVGARYKVTELLEKALLAEYPSAQVRREGSAKAKPLVRSRIGPAAVILDVGPVRHHAIEWIAAHAHTPFAMSRSLNFWILPVLVFGNSVNTTCFGTL